MYAYVSRGRQLSGTRPHNLLPNFSMRLSTPWSNPAAGFTLIEVMIITAIIGMLVAIGAPSLRAYANKSRVAKVTATSSAIRTALETYAVDTEGSYPPAATLVTWQNWRDFLAQFSTPMPATSVEAGIRTITYTAANPETYNVQIEVNVPNGVTGKNIVLTPQGITRN